jgi:hypothetical protein
MKLRLVHYIAVLAALAALATQARADCVADIDKAIKLAQTLPDSPGRQLLYQDIAAARDARHEGDEKACEAQMDRVFQILRESGKK